MTHSIIKKNDDIDRIIKLKVQYVHYKGLCTYRYM